MKREIIIFIDSGDTIIDEGSEIRDQNEIVLEAAVIEGADTVLRTLKDNHYRIALVADGYAQSFHNIYNFLGLHDCFEQMICSSEVGEHKPHPKMFETALEKMRLTGEDCKNIIMVGNNLERDVVGAKRMGIISVFLDWTPRYPLIPRSEEEVPDYTIHRPVELLSLIHKLEEQSI